MTECYCKEIAENDDEVLSVSEILDYVRKPDLFTKVMYSIMGVCGVGLIVGMVYPFIYFFN